MCPVADPAHEDARRLAEEIARLLFKLNWINMRRGGAGKLLTNRQAFERVVKDLLTADVFAPGGIQPALNAYDLSRYREGLEAAQRIALEHANRWANEPNRSDARMQACLGVESAIRSLLEGAREKEEVRRG